MKKSALEHSDKPILNEAFKGIFHKWTPEEFGEESWGPFLKILISSEGLNQLNNLFISSKKFDFGDYLPKTKPADVNYGSGNGNLQITAKFEFKLDKKALNLLLIGDKDGLQAKSTENLDGILWNDKWGGLCEFFTGKKALSDFLTSSSDNDEADETDEAADADLMKAYREIIKEEEDDDLPLEEEADLTVDSATMQIFFSLKPSKYAEEVSGSKLSNPHYVETFTGSMWVGFKESGEKPQLVATFTYKPYRRPTFLERMGQTFKNKKPLDAAILTHAASMLFGGVFNKAKITFTVKEDFSLSNNNSNETSSRAVVQGSTENKMESIAGQLVEKFKAPFVDISEADADVQLKSANDSTFAFTLRYRGIILYACTLKIVTKKK